MKKDEKIRTEKKANEENEQEEMIGPNPRKLRKVDYHDLLLDNLPSAENYEISYMHKDVINNILTSTKRDLIITFSIDGHVKFWEKVFHLVEFRKNFKAHTGLITGSALSKNQDTLCTVGVDKTLKIFDLLNVDLRNVIKLTFSPLVCDFIPHQGYDSPLIAVSEEKSGRIMIIDFERNVQNGFNEEDQINQVQHQKVPESEIKLAKQQSSKSEYIIKTLNMHKHPIKFMKMNWNLGFCLSIDERSIIQLWTPFNYDFPTNLHYSCKVQTDYLELIRSNSMPIAISISPKGKYLSVILKDKIIRIFNLMTGKNIGNINESVKQIVKIQEDSSDFRHSDFALEQGEFQKRIGIEKDIQISKDIFNTPQMEFDEAQQYLIYPSFHGIKFYSLLQKNVDRILGKKEHQRFIRISLFQGRVMRNPAGSSTNSGQRKSSDPTIYCTSFKKPRFFIFSKRSPDIGPENDIIRDIINEKTYKEEHQNVNEVKITEKKNQVVLHTSLGDIHLQLYLQDCPKTCENFIKLAKKKFYDGLIFHRVMKGFMIQGGCSKGDGTGGQSIWGQYFEDQLCPQKHRFDKPYVLAMANRGPNTNGSQFFITVNKCSWLDNKHTIFGRVTKGIETVIQINKLKTDKNEKPLVNVIITSVRIQ